MELCFKKVIIISAIIEVILIAILYNMMRKLDEIPTHNDEHDKAYQMLNISMFFLVVLFILNIITLLGMYTDGESKYEFGNMIY